MDDHPVVSHGENVARGDETDRPWMEIRYSCGNYLCIVPHMSRNPFTDARALELARIVREEHIFMLTLDVAHLSPTSEGTKELAASLETADVRKIQIECRGSSTDKSAQIYGVLSVLLAALKGNQTLSSLCLSDCAALGDDLAAFVESRPSNLTKIDLIDCHLADPYNPRLLRSIGRAVHQRYLTSFCFSERSSQPRKIELSNFAVVKLSLDNGEALPSNCIQDLVADFGDLHHVSVSGRAPLVSLRSMHCSITKLSVQSSFCNLEDAHLLDVILRTQAGSLKELTLHFWMMNLECCQVVLPGMDVCRSLSSLRMSGSMWSVSDRGAWIGRLLRSCPQLTSLSLDEYLRDSDINLFIEDLRTHRMLKRLEVRFHSVDYFDALADGLRHNASLETLELFEYGVCDLTPLFRMLVDRDIPTDLFLKGNCCDHRGWDALSDALDSGARLRKLRLDVNPFDDCDCRACIRFIRGMASHPHLKEFELSWMKRPIDSYVVPKRDLLECLISAIGSFQFLEKLSFEWIKDALDWDDWKDALLAAVKQNESLVKLRVDGVGDKDFKGCLNFYTLRNRVNRTLESSARGLWGDLLFQLHQCPERSVGISVMFLTFKTHATLIETAGCSRSTKRRLAEGKEDTDKSPK